MSGSNDFLVFAGAPGANVITQATYASLAALAGGFVSGVAESNQLNKVWRQGSIMAAVIGTMIADITGQNATDDGTTATLAGNLLTTMQTAEYTHDTSSAANTYTLTYVPTPIVPLTDGATYTFKPAHTNTGASTLSINGSPAHSIVSQTLNALTGGEIVAGGVCSVTYVAASTSFVILTNSTSISGSVGASGNVKFANGLILQWREVTAGTSTGSFTWPTTFPNAFFAAVASTTGGGGGYVTLTSPSTSGANWALGGTSSTSFYVFALGN